MRNPGSGCLAKSASPHPLPRVIHIRARRPRIRCAPRPTLQPSHNTTFGPGYHLPSPTSPSASPPPALPPPRPVAGYSTSRYQFLLVAAKTMLPITSTNTTPIKTGTSVNNSITAVPPRQLGSVSVPRLHNPLLTGCERIGYDKQESSGNETIDFRAVLRTQKSRCLTSSGIIE